MKDDEFEELHGIRGIVDIPRPEMEVAIAKGIPFSEVVKSKLSWASKQIHEEYERVWKKRLDERSAELKRRYSELLEEVEEKGSVCVYNCPGTRSILDDER